MALPLTDRRSDQAPQQRRAVIYLRISNDPTHEAAGVERQRQDCLDYCDGQGWSVVAVEEDNDTSAWSGVKRPGYLRALDLIDSGGADTLVAYHLDRLWRRPKELEALIERAEHGVVVATLNGQLDLTDGDGRAWARILVTMAAKSSDDTSRRVRSQKQHIRAQGVPLLGRRPFGYVAGLGALDEDEAARIREAIAAVIAGATLTDIARRWTAESVPTTQGGRWTAVTVKGVLSHPRNAALVADRDTEGRWQVSGEGRWPAIVDRATWERVSAVLEARAMAGRSVHPRRSSAFTGIIRCGRCGTALERATNSYGTSLWRCRKKVGHDGCGGVSVVAAPVETMIVDATMETIDSGAVGRRLARETAAQSAQSDAAGLADQLAEVERRLDEAADLFARGKIKPRQLDRITATLDAEAAGLRARLTRGAAVSAAAPYEGRPGALAAAWPTLTDATRRAVISYALRRVTILPATSRRTFDPNRVVVGDVG